MYTWQLPDWPNYQFDVRSASHAQGQFALTAARNQGMLAAMGQDSDFDARIDLMVDAAIETSAIEGELLNRDDVRSSIKNHFLPAGSRTPVHDPAAAGISSLILETRERFQEPLTEELLHHWQRLVVPSNVKDGHGDARIPTAGWRTHPEPMQIVSGTINRPTVHYEATPSDRVPAEMATFIDWFNGESTSLPGVARAAIAHLWFETIHPYEDGNGRVGRAIADMALSQSLGEPTVVSMATVISRDKKAYYANLNAASKDTLIVDDWVMWFSDRAIESQRLAQAIVQQVLRKSQLLADVDHAKLNERQKKVLTKLADAEPDGFEGGLNTSKYRGIAKTSKPTATRDIQGLVAGGFLEPIHTKGRYAKYRLAPAYRAPEVTPDPTTDAPTRLQGRML